MSNFQNLYDYGFDGANIQVWPTEKSDMIAIEAGDFFAWLTNKGYATDYKIIDTDGYIAIDTSFPQGIPEWEPWDEWWINARVINGRHLFPLTVDLKGELLCEYLNDTDNVHYTVTRTVAEFLTAAIINPDFKF